MVNFKNPRVELQLAPEQNQNLSLGAHMVSSLPCFLVFSLHSVTPVQLPLFPRPCGRRWLLLLLPMYVGVESRKIPRFLGARGNAGAENTGWWPNLERMITSLVFDESRLRYLWTMHVKRPSWVCGSGAQLSWVTVYVWKPKERRGGQRADKFEVQAKETETQSRQRCSTGPRMRQHADLIHSSGCKAR